MTAPSPASREFARGVIRLEAGGRCGGDALADAANRAFVRFHWHMERLVGSAGFSALARRALGQARAEHPLLRDVAVPADPSAGLEGLRESLRERDAADAYAAIESVLAHVIELLFRFLGVQLTVRLLRGAWPGLETPDVPEGPAEGP